MTSQTAITGITFRGQHVELDHEHSPLTSRQAQVWALGAVGLSEAQSGRSLGIEVHTANTHRNHLFNAVGASCMIHAVSLLFDADKARANPVPADQSLFPVNEKRLRILRGLSQGYTMAEIGDQPPVTSYQTIKSLLVALRRPLQLPNTASVMFYGYASGTLHPRTAAQHTDQEKITWPRRHVSAR